MSKTKTTGVGARFGNKRESLLSQHGVIDPARVDNIEKTEQGGNENNANEDSLTINKQTAVMVTTGATETKEVTETTETTEATTVSETNANANNVKIDIVDTTEIDVKTETEDAVKNTEGVPIVEEVQQATEAERYATLKQASFDAQVESIGNTVVPDEVLQKKLHKAEQVAVHEAQTVLGITYTNIGNANTYTQAAGPATPEAFQEHQERMLADIATAIANETDPAVIQAMLQEKMNAMTQDTAMRQATCLPKSREDCLRCPCNVTCKRSLARYKVVTTSVRMTEDIKTALEIMVNEDMYQANITMSSVVSLALQAVVEPYLEEARNRIAEKTKRLEELRKKGIYTPRR